MENIFWKEIEVVIFDVDGTLYGQSKLRKIMAFKLLVYYIVRPWKYKELLMIYHFRKEREKRAGYKGENLQEEQYIWCAEKMNIEVEKVIKVVDKWIFDFPNRYLSGCMYPGVAQFFTALREQGIRTAIYSDYDSGEKLKHMQLYADMEISSTDKRVNSFKPLPDGLSFILSEMGITKKDNCLYIGDRFELDGLCAEAAGVPFLLIDKKDAHKDFYIKLLAGLAAKNTMLS